MDNDEIAAAVKDGAIQFFLPADAARSVEAKIHYEDLGVHFIAPEVVHIEIQQTENNGILLLSIAAVAVSIGCFVCWRMRKPQPKLPDPPPASRYEYAGKLKLYVTQSPDDGDIAPMEYNLYRNFRKEEISLGTILAHCGIKLPFSGAHKIFFAPGANKALILSNHSDCTVLKNRDLLVKNHSCLLYFNERVHITFEDERSELILEYKNVKPSERK